MTGMGWPTMPRLGFGADYQPTTGPFWSPPSSGSYGILASYDRPVVSGSVSSFTLAQAHSRSSR